MYLAGLDIEKKYLFRDLSIHVAKIDGEFSELEKVVIDAHCLEMRVDNNNYETELSFDKVLLKIKEIFDTSELRMIYLEIVSVVLADNIVKSNEKELLSIISGEFGFSKEEEKEAIDILDSLKKVYERMTSFIEVK